MSAGAWRRRMRAETRGKSAFLFGVLAPVETDSPVYRRWAENGVGETRRALYRFCGRAPRLEDGISYIFCRGKRYLVLESRRVEISGRAVMTDALVREE